MDNVSKNLLECHQQMIKYVIMVILIQQLMIMELQDMHALEIKINLEKHH